MLIDPKHPPLWLLRTTVIIGLPFILPFVFCNTLIRGFGRTVWYAYLEAGITIDDARAMWNGRYNPPPTESTDHD